MAENIKFFEINKCKLSTSNIILHHTVTKYQMAFIHA